MARYGVEEVITGKLLMLGATLRFSLQCELTYGWKI